MVTPYDSPPAATQPAPTRAGTIRGSIDTGDARILNAAMRGSRLVASQTVGSDGAAHARWYEFNITASTATLRQSGEISRGGINGAPDLVNTYYPSIDIAANGDLGMTFMESTSTEFMSMWITGRKETDALGAMETPSLVGAGQGAYSDGPPNPNPFRAGDYSGISVDPSANNLFWAANEFASKEDPANGADWLTKIASFSILKPTLRAGSQLAAINTGSRDYAKNVFAVGSDGKLYDDRFSSYLKTWEWDPLGPAKTPFTIGPAAAIDDHNLWVAIVGSDGNLYTAQHDFRVQGTAWTWAIQPNPGARLSGQPSAVSGDGYTINLFVKGTDQTGTSKLFHLHHDPGSGWSWQTIPQLNGASLAGDPVAYRDNWGNTNVYVTGSDGNMHVLHADPGSNAFAWSPDPNLSNPGASVSLAGNPTAIYGPFNNGIETVFVRGSNALQVLQYDPSNGWTWQSESQPAGVSLDGNPVVLLHYYNVFTPISFHVYVTGIDQAGSRDLYVYNYLPWSGTGTWTKLGHPPAGFASDPVALNNFGATFTEDVFVVGADGLLYRCHQNPDGTFTGWVSQN
jgi:hypothetical protein